MLTEDILNRIWAKTLTKLYLVAEDELELFNKLDGDKFLLNVGSANVKKVEKLIDEVIDFSEQVEYSIEDVIFCDTYSYFNVFFREIKRILTEAEEDESKFEGICEELLRDFWTCLYDLAEQAKLTTIFLDDEFTFTEECRLGITRIAEQIVHSEKIPEPELIRDFIFYSESMMYEAIGNAYDWLEVNDKILSGAAIVEQAVRYGTIYYPLLLISTVLFEMNQIIGAKVGVKMDYDVKTIDIISEKAKTIMGKNTDFEKSKYWTLLDE
jgi:hypothetical protein